jgi:hypothetical protein
MRRSSAGRLLSTFFSKSSGETSRAQAMAPLAASFMECVHVPHALLQGKCRARHDALLGEQIMVCGVAVAARALHYTHLLQVDSYYNFSCLDPVGLRFEDSSKARAPCACIHMQAIVFSHNSCPSRNRYRKGPMTSGAIADAVENALSLDEFSDGAIALIDVILLSSYCYMSSISRPMLI